MRALSPTIAGGSKGGWSPARDDAGAYLRTGGDVDVVHVGDGACRAAVVLSVVMSALLPTIAGAASSRGAPARTVAPTFAPVATLMSST